MQSIDDALVGSMVQTYDSAPVLWTAARWLTEAGGAVALVTITIIAGLLLLFRGQPRRAFALMGVTLGGRGVVELLKWWTDRPRPQLFDHPVVTHSLSFPSGHAGNSTIVYLALALVAAPVITRARWPSHAALLLAGAIGLTRPILGVHWPSDVLAGWALGLAWTLSAVWPLRRWFEGRPTAS